MPPRYHPDYVRLANVTLVAVTGEPVDGYCSSPSRSPAAHRIHSGLRVTGEFGLPSAPAGTWAPLRAGALRGFHLALPSRWRDDLLLLSYRSAIWDQRSNEL